MEGLVHLAPPTFAEPLSSSPGSQVVTGPLKRTLHLARSTDAVRPPSAVATCPAAPKAATAAPPPRTRSIKLRRQRCGWDATFREEALGVPRGD